MRFASTVVFFVAFLYISLSGVKKSFGQCANSANIYSFSYNGKNYEVVKELKTWVAASSCAVQRGGYLVEINDAGEQNAVYNAIIGGAGVSSSYSSVSDGGGSAYVWIGATDKNSEGTWLWDGNNDASGINFWNGQGNAGTGGGSALAGAYVNWGGTSTGSPNEPDNYNNNQNAAAICLGVWPYGSGGLGIAGEWNDIAMSNSLYYVIEYNPSGILNLNNDKGNINIYLNPAKTVVNVELGSTGNGIHAITLYNLLGTEVLKKNYSFVKNVSFDLAGLSSGIYFISVKLSNGNTVKKKLTL